MFILDTNIISELMRDHPHPAVLAWLDARLSRELFVTAVTEAEVYTGLAYLPPGPSGADTSPKRPTVHLTDC